MQAYKDDLVANPPKLATRAASGNALKVLTENLTDMVSGSADLEGSNKTRTPATSSEIQADNYSGRYINYGIREHIMGAAMNGMALHGGIWRCMAASSLTLAPSLFLPIIAVQRYASRR